MAIVIGKKYDEEISRLKDRLLELEGKESSGRPQDQRPEGGAGDTDPEEIESIKKRLSGLEKAKQDGSKTGANEAVIRLTLEEQKKKAVKKPSSKKKAAKKKPAAAARKNPAKSARKAPGGKKKPAALTEKEEYERFKADFLKLKQRIQNLEKNRRRGMLKPTTEFKRSISRLNSNIERLLVMVSSVAAGSKAPDASNEAPGSEKDAPDKTGEKLARVIEQNEKIAAGILALADMLEGSKKQAADAPPEHAQKPFPEAAAQPQKTTHDDIQEIFQTRPLKLHGSEVEDGFKLHKLPLIDRRREAPKKDDREFRRLFSTGPAQEQGLPGMMELPSELRLDKEPVKSNKAPPPPFRFSEDKS